MVLQWSPPLLLDPPEGALAPPLLVTRLSLSRSGGETSAVLLFQGTAVYPLLASVLFDEAEWEQPHTFHPAHFLDQEGKFVKPDAFLPFSAGSSAHMSDLLVLPSVGR